MTAEIIGLFKPDAAWRAMEDGVRNAVSNLGYGAEVADWVFEDLKKRPFQVQHLTPKSLDEIAAEARPHLEEVLHSLKDAYNRIMINWIIEIVKLECELWVAKFADKE